MTIKKMDHVGIIVDDLTAAKTFFGDLGFVVRWEGEMDGELLDRVVGLDDAKTAVAMIALPDGQGTLELIEFHTPRDDNGIQQPQANTLGIRHLAFVVDDIEATVADLKRKGTETFGEIQNFEDTFKLVYVRGPEGIIVELAQALQ